MISSPLLSRFDFNNLSVTLFTRTTHEKYTELFPAIQLKIMQSVIVARGTWQIGVDSGLLIKAGTWNILDKFLEHSGTSKIYKHRHKGMQELFSVNNKSLEVVP